MYTIPKPQMYKITPNGLTSGMFTFYFEFLKLNIINDFSELVSMKREPSGHPRLFISSEL